MKIDWSDKELHEFVSEHINYYGFDVSPEQTKSGISPWKQWLWLEKYGFDFAYQSLEREINHFRLSEVPSGVSLYAERRLLILIRNTMRKILLLPALSEEDERVLLQTVPISNWTHWGYVAGHIEAEIDEGVEYGDIADFIWDFMKRDKPAYLDIIKKISQYDELSPERFQDNYTINGTYDLMMGPSQKSGLYYKVSQFHIIRSYDMFFAPGNLRLYRAVSDAYIGSVDKRL